MKINYLLVLTVILAALVIGCTAQTQIKETNGNSDKNNSINSQTVSLSELNKHNNKDDCWVAYEGKIYDVTKFLPLHPGGSAAIEKYCGTASEFETGFTKKHGTEKVSVLLQQIYKGDLVQ